VELRSLLFQESESRQDGSERSNMGDAMFSLSESEECYLGTQQAVATPDNIERRIDEHLDDDMPADREWLLSIGFSEWLFSHGSVGVEIYNRLCDVKVLVLNYSVLHLNGTSIIHHPTRRQVRLICEAVGVSLNETEDAVEQETHA